MKIKKTVKLLSVSLLALSMTSSHGMETEQEENPKDCCEKKDMEHDRKLFYRFCDELEIQNGCRLNKPFRLEAYEKRKGIFLSEGDTVHKIYKIPDSLSFLTNLIELHLSYNDLGAIPPAVFSLTNLISLGCIDNNLIEVNSKIGKLTNLKELFLGYNPFTHLPTEIGNLKELRKLSLERACHLKSIPTEIYELQNLRELKLEGVDISSQITPEYKKVGKQINRSSYRDRGSKSLDEQKNTGDSPLKDVVGKITHL